MLKACRLRAVNNPVDLMGVCVGGGGDGARRKGYMGIKASF